MVDANQYDDLVAHLGISIEEWELLEALGVELNRNESDDGLLYSYWFTVPEGTPEEILEKTGWRVGESINNIDSDLVDPASEPEPYY